jgi:LmbE family N-acetylglucosaminyl deacetylase
MVFAIPAVLQKVLSGAAPTLFLSPHLDDAVLSCGALIRYLTHRGPATVATVFTAADPGPHTWAARRFLRRCNCGDAASLFRERRAEDVAVLRELGAERVHLGFPDALFRRRQLSNPPARWLSRAVPELGHRYPTYRFDIARGRVAPGDQTMITAVAEAAGALLERTGAEVLFCPLGVGRHVDHLIVRAVGERFADRVVYYSDFPYHRSAAADPAFIARHGLLPCSWAHGLSGKDRLILGYRTQAEALFPGLRIPVAPEIYYGAADS